MSTAEFSAELDVPIARPAGEQLAAARANRGLSITEIAQHLKLSPWQVEALEAGDHRRLPSPVFVRGFIRNYARLVKLDPAGLLEGADREPPAAALSRGALGPSAEIPYPIARRVNWYKYAILAAVALIPLAVYEFYYLDTSESGIKTGQVESPPQVAADTSTTATPPPGVLPSTVLGDAPASSAAPVEASAATSSPATGAAARPGEHIVRLRFARESWVEIRDRSGRKIFSKINAPGTEQTVSGLPPLQLIVGNANGVEVTHNEQPVNLGPHTKVNVARLTLE
ncbi:MAG TPA: RodZ domain-containing protein [Burkholderiales bacterium]|nr:RodZ domain-containing protein [Burkholderiales bacterium]